MAVRPQAVSAITASVMSMQQWKQSSIEQREPREKKKEKAKAVDQAEVALALAHLKQARLLEEDCLAALANNQQSLAEARKEELRRHSR